MYFLYSHTAKLLLMNKLYITGHYIVGLNSYKLFNYNWECSNWRAECAWSSERFNYNSFASLLSTFGWRQSKIAF